MITGQQTIKKIVFIIFHDETVFRFLEYVFVENEKVHKNLKNFFKKKTDKKYLKILQILLVFDILRSRIKFVTDRSIQQFSLCINTHHG